jgi:hypothetical protein
MIMSTLYPTQLSYISWHVLFTSVMVAPSELIVVLRGCLHLGQNTLTGVILSNTSHCVSLHEKKHLKKYQDLYKMVTEHMMHGPCEALFVFLTFTEKSASTQNTAVAIHREYSRYRIHKETCEINNGLT